jgi:hypothetical protein
MDSTTLRPEQIAHLSADVRRNLHYLNRLTERMTRQGWPVHDPLDIAAKNARNSMQDLFVATHYASCPHGMGRAEK